MPKQTLWIAVGHITEGAMKELLDAEVTVQRVSEQPQLFLLGLHHQEWYQDYWGGLYADVEITKTALLLRSQHLDLNYYHYWEDPDITHTALYAVGEYRPVIYDGERPQEEKQSM